jgi:hypothetical protein
MIRLPFIAGFIALAAITTSAEVASAFVATGGRWPQPGGLGTPVTITYSYQNMFDGGLRGPGALPGPNGMFLPNGPPLPNALIRASIEEALGLWASVAPLTFIEVPDDGLTYAQGSTQYGQIRFRHVHINGPDPAPPAQPVAKAQAWFPFAGTLAGDVEFDHGDPWQQAGTLPVPDILGATIHELGHSLGLNHTGFSNANLYWIFTRYPGPGTGALHSDDIAGIRFLYGTGRGKVVPLPFFTPEPSALTLLLFAGPWFFARRRRR